MSGTTTPNIETRGHSTVNEKAPIDIRILALIIDLAWVIALYFLAVWLFDISPIPSLTVLLTYFIVAGSFWFVQQFLFGSTLGQFIWSLRLLDKNRSTLSVFFSESSLESRSWLDVAKQIPLARIYQRERLDAKRFTTALLMTVALSAASAGFIHHSFVKNPMMTVAQDWVLPAFAPAPENKAWKQLPFYYSMGAWPTRFTGNPVIYTLPYMKKGPPRHFPGQIVARWQGSQTRITLEGPKTPNPRIFPETAKKCMTHGLLSAGIGCVSIRATILEKHYYRMKKRNPSDWSLKWFEIQNPALSKEETPRGVYFSIRSEKSIEERFIVFSQKGTLQTFVLNRPNDSTTENPGIAQVSVQARKLFYKAIGTLRIVEELKGGRALAAYQLQQSTNMVDPSAIPDARSYVTKLAEAQAVLLSAISVEPRNLTNYHLLGGTALMIYQYIAKARNQKHQVMSAERASLFDDWSTTARPTIHAALRYSRDINKEHPKTHQLELIWNEARKIQ